MNNPPIQTPPTSAQPTHDPVGELTISGQPPSRRSGIAGLVLWGIGLGIGLLGAISFSTALTEAAEQGPAASYGVGLSGAVMFGLMLIVSGIAWAVGVVVSLLDCLRPHRERTLPVTGLILNGSCLLIAWIKVLGPIFSFWD
jgi:hypothetical protein